MSCFCVESVRALAAQAPSTSPEAADAIANSATAQAVRALDSQLASGVAGLPPPVELPDTALPPAVVAQVAAAAQLRAQAQAACRIDLRTQIGVTAVARVAATLDARMSSPEFPTPNLDAWEQLASLDAAATRVATAAAAQQQTQEQGQAQASTERERLTAVTVPPDWKAFAARLQTLSLLMTASVQLGVELSAVAAFNEAASAAVSVALPELPTANLAAMCRLSTGLAAVAQLQTSLGVRPTEAGLQQVQRMVASRVSNAMRAASQAGVQVMERPTLQQVAGLPPFATAATIRAAAALDASALAALEVSAAVSASLTVALAATAFVANLQAALGIGAASTPCGVCDSRAVMASLSVGLAA